MVKLSFKLHCMWKSGKPQRSVAAEWFGPHPSVDPHTVTHFSSYHSSYIFGPFNRPSQ